MRPEEDRSMVVALAVEVARFCDGDEAARFLGGAPMRNATMQWRCGAFEALMASLIDDGSPSSSGHSSGHHSVLAPPKVLPNDVVLYQYKACSFCDKGHVYSPVGHAFFFF